MKTKLRQQCRLVLIGGLVLVHLVGFTERSWGKDVHFQWSILAENNGTMEGLDFSTAPVVNSGTALQIYLEHLENCYIYLFLLDSSKILTPIYPTAPGYYNYGFPRGPKLIPPGQESFSFVPPPGIETFILIATAERLFQIEQLTEEYSENPQSPGQKNLLLEELETLMEGREAQSRRVEDRERVEVKVKTGEGLIVRTFEAIEVNINDFYGRRLEIDHR